MPPQAVLDSKPRPAFARERATAEKPSHAFVGNNHTQLEYHPILDSEQVQASTEEHSECCCRILMCSGCVPVCLCPVLGCVVVVEYSATPRFNIQHMLFLNTHCVQCAYCVYHPLQVVNPSCIHATIPDTEDRVVKKADNISAFMDLVFSLVRQIKNKQVNIS